VAEAQEVMAQIQAEHSRLGEALEGVTEAQLDWRPPNGKWTVRENLRHLALTGYAHLQFLGLPAWNDFGFAEALPLTPRAKFVGYDSSAVSVLLAAWGAAIAQASATIGGATGSSRLQRHLAQHVAHQRQHVLQIEKLLRAHAREQRAGG
jgi:hypothetical protein